MSGTTHERIGEQSVLHRREFAAPAEAVQRAHTVAELFARWMGPRGSRCRIDRLDARTGGSFDYTVEVGDLGFRFWGSYHEVVEGRIVHTWEFEGDPGERTLETLELRELGEGRSVLEVTSTYASRAACDAMLASGMDAGMDEDFERLDEVLASLAG